MFQKEKVTLISILPFLKWRCGPQLQQDCVARIVATLPQATPTTLLDILSSVCSHMASFLLQPLFTHFPLQFPTKNDFFAPISLSQHLFTLFLSIFPHRQTNTTTTTTTCFSFTTLKTIITHKKKQHLQLQVWCSGRYQSCNFTWSERGRQ